MSDRPLHFIACFGVIALAYLSCTPGSATERPKSGEASSSWSRASKVQRLFADRARKSLQSSRSLERRFDLDRDGVLNRYEAGLMRTHLIYGWELADSKKKKKYDFDRDHLLNPMEYARYHKDKDDAGRIKGEIFFDPADKK